MLLEAGKIKLNIEPGPASGRRDVILFLHGFTGSTVEWEEVVPLIDPRFECIALDLVGHGLSDSPAGLQEYSASSITAHIKEVISKLDTGKIILAGYSMGGRAALTYAAAWPGDIKALLLESSSPGIADQAERMLRKKSDDQLAQRIYELGVEEFIKYWMNIPLFESQKSLPALKQQHQFIQKLKNNVTGLSLSLQGFGTGVMPPLYDKLKNMNFPLLLITGGLDSKFTGINRKIAASSPAVKHVIIPGAGHNVHFEQPQTFAREVNRFLNDLK